MARCLRPGARTLRQLRLAEIEPARHGEEPSGLIGVGQECSENDPVVGSDGGGAVGAACGVLMERAGAPNVGVAAMDLGVVERPDMVAIPEPGRGLLDEPRQRARDVVVVPGAVLGEGLQGFPVAGPVEGEHGLSDRVLLDIDR